MYALVSADVERSAYSPEPSLIRISFVVRVKPLTACGVVVVVVVVVVIAVIVVVFVVADVVAIVVAIVLTIAHHRTRVRRHKTGSNGFGRGGCI